MLAKNTKSVDNADYPTSVEDTTAVSMQCTYTCTSGTWIRSTSVPSPARTVRGARRRSWYELYLFLNAPPTIHYGF